MSCLGFEVEDFAQTFDISTGTFTSEVCILNGIETAFSLSGDCEFVENQLVLSETAILSLQNATTNAFNYYALSYKTDAYLKGTIVYKQNGESAAEDFFLKPTENEFYSLIDACWNNEKAKSVESIAFTVLDKPSATLSIDGIATFNRKVVDKEVYCCNEDLKIGVNLSWDGALSYIEDLNSNVQVVKKNGHVYVDSDAASRYKTIPLNNRVNLINAYDTGRLVQQSYYGYIGEGYTSGVFMDNVWSYNPVQGGNQFNEASKIVDIRCSENSIYIKCRPLDWAKEKEYITPSYMEATYTLTGSILDVSCGYTDFSDYPSRMAEQEMPAFYCIEPLNHFYYSNNGEVKCKDDLIFRPDAGHPVFQSDENWIAFAGEFADSFGVGLYVPGGTNFIAGIYLHGETTKSNPSKDAATSYAALTRTFEFRSFNPISYNYSITTGTVDEIRSTFNTLQTMQK